MRGDFSRLQNEAVDIATGAAAAGGFIGAAWAAWRKFAPMKPPEDGELKALMRRVEETERRMNHFDERINKVFDLLGDALDKLGECRTDIKEALVRLEERRK